MMPLSMYSFDGKIIFGKWLLVIEGNKQIACFGVSHRKATNMLNSSVEKCSLFHQGNGGRHFNDDQLFQAGYFFSAIREKRNN